MLCRVTRHTKKKSRSLLTTDCTCIHHCCDAATKNIRVSTCTQVTYEKWQGEQLAVIGTRIGWWHVACEKRRVSSCRSSQGFWKVHVCPQLKFLLLKRIHIYDTYLPFSILHTGRRMIDWLFRHRLGTKAEIAENSFDNIEVWSRSLDPLDISVATFSTYINIMIDFLILLSSTMAFFSCK